VGNREVLTTTAGVVTYTYDAANRLTSVGGETYTWDNRGNLTHDGTFTTTYDAAGRLVGAQSITNTLVYTYNGDGVRVAMSADGVETRWVQDVTGLPEVLSEASGGSAMLYLYGVGHLAQVEGASTEWFLGDALGSVRQVVDDGGEVVLARDYAPFGVVFSESGTANSAFGFASEQQNGNTGLIFLRARYLDPSLGRFLSQDVWEGSIQRPATLHKYIYAEDNPVNRRDPGGHSAIPGFDPEMGGQDARDLTDWLYRELTHNVNDPVVVSLRRMNKLSKGMMRFGGCVAVPVPVIGAGMYADALWTYKTQVENGARWDFKDEIGLKLGPGIALCTSGACFSDIEFSVPGNIFFAYIGRAAGFSDIELQQGAALADIIDPAHREEHEEYVGPYEGEFAPGPTWWDLSTWNWGDEPKDHEAVTLGVKLWSKYGDRLTRSQFRDELSEYIGRLDRGAPRARPVRSEIAENWPYPVGYFDNKGVPYTGEEP
jgi:RHS repeat-associated protein